MSQQERCPNCTGLKSEPGLIPAGNGYEDMCRNAFHEPAAKPEPNPISHQTASDVTCWCGQIHVSGNEKIMPDVAPAPASVPDDWILPFELLKRIAKSDRVQAEGGAPEELIEAVLLESGAKPAPASVPQPGESGQDMNAVLDSAELVGDQALRTAIYEFRKRRDRALAADAGKGSTESEKKG